MWFHFPECNGHSLILTLGGERVNVFEKDRSSSEITMARRICLFPVNYGTTNVIVIKTDVTSIENKNFISHDINVLFAV